jgi:hypothetical protein
MLSRRGVRVSHMNMLKAQQGQAHWIPHPPSRQPSVRFAERWANRKKQLASCREDIRRTLMGLGGGGGGLAPPFRGPVVEQAHRAPVHGRSAGGIDREVGGHSRRAGQFESHPGRGLGAPPASWSKVPQNRGPAREDRARYYRSRVEKQYPGRANHAVAGYCFSTRDRQYRAWSTPKNGLILTTRTNDRDTRRLTTDAYKEPSQSCNSLQTPENRSPILTLSV